MSGDRRSLLLTSVYALTATYPLLGLRSGAGYDPVIVTIALMALALSYSYISTADCTASHRHD